MRSLKAMTDESYIASKIKVVKSKKEVVFILSMQGPQAQYQELLDRLSKNEDPSTWGLGSSDFIIITDEDILLVGASATSNLDNVIIRGLFNKVEMGAVEGVWVDLQNLDL